MRSGAFSKKIRSVGSNRTKKGAGRISRTFDTRGDAEGLSPPHHYHAEQPQYSVYLDVLTLSD